jgi:hypothetical protein
LTVTILQKHKEFKVIGDTKKKLLRISASTIDRILKPERKKYELKGRSFTKPGTLLKNQIPIRTFADWDEQRPGFVEIDLFGHDGGDLRGDFIQTLNVTDVYTGWTEMQAVKKKAQICVFEALKYIRERLPFDLLGIDSDCNLKQYRNRQSHYKPCLLNGRIMKSLEMNINSGHYFF